MENVQGYRCSRCGREYEFQELRYTCPQDDGNLDILFDHAFIRRKLDRPGFPSRENSLWRFLPLLPVSDPAALGINTPFRAVGCTPLFAPSRCRSALGLKQLWLKDESFNPTASLKDRASTIVIRHALEIEAQTVVTASTGNAGAALAGMAAALGRRAVVFAPRDAPQAKVAQLLVFGAQVLLVDGSYDDAVDLSLKTAEAFGWYCRNTGTNPFTLEGKKTAALEIWEAMFSGKIQIGAEPLSVFVSVGDGNIISGLHKGFKDLHALGWLEQIPRLYGVQAEGSAAIARTFTSGSEVIQPVEARTLADSISVNSPGDGQRALRAVRETGGQYVTVTDEQILQAVAELGRDGIFAEPAGAAGYAGLVAAVAQGLIDPKDPVLVINTGSGLKDPRSATLAVGQPSIIEPTLQAVQKQIEVQIEH